MLVTRNRGITHLRSNQSMMTEVAFGIKGGHATGAGGADRLAVVVVGHVTRGEHAVHARVGAGERRPLDVAGRSQFHLPAEEADVWRVADGEEQAGRREFLL